MILRGNANALPLADESISAVVTDPPYGLGNCSPAATRECLTAWLAGEDYHPRGGGFMGKEWDSWVPSPRTFAESWRVLKPGGHIVCFASSRTLDLMALSLRLAGFEIRDTINWLYWSGFPKSLDVSKAIDAAAGAEREVVGHEQNWGASTAEDGKVGYGDYAGQWDITAPATGAAKAWQGWGTALKPAFEPAILARKPLSGTVAATVLEHGTGGLNIDACRYAYGDAAWPGPNSVCDWTVGTVRSNVGFCMTAGEVTTPPSDLGRWPANIYACPKASRAEREAGLTAENMLCQCRSPLSTGTSKATGHSTDDADPAISGSSSSPNVCEKCGKRRSLTTGAEAVERQPGSAGMNSPRAGSGRTAGVVMNSHPT